MASAYELVRMAFKYQTFYKNLDNNRRLPSGIAVWPITGYCTKRISDIRLWYQPQTLHVLTISIIASSEICAPYKRTFVYRRESVERIITNITIAIIFESSMSVLRFVIFLQIALAARLIVDAALIQTTPIVQNLNLMNSSLTYPTLNTSIYGLDPVSYRKLVDDGIKLVEQSYPGVQLDGIECFTRHIFDDGYPIPIGELKQVKTIRLHFWKPPPHHLGITLEGNYGRDFSTDLRWQSPVPDNVYTYTHHWGPLTWPPRHNIFEALQTARSFSGGIRAFTTAYQDFASTEQETVEVHSFVFDLGPHVNIRVDTGERWPSFTGTYAAGKILLVGNITTDGNTYS